MQLNAEDGGNRKYIMVQLPEQTDEKSEAYKVGYKTICEIGKERIRRASNKIKEEKRTNAEKDGMFANLEDTQDYGFRVFRLDESNMQDVYYRPQDYKQENLDLFADNVKPDRTADDLLAQVMLDWGLPLSLKIEQININGKQVFKVANNSLYACFDKDIDEEFAKEIAKDKPLRIVFRDNGFKNDTAKTNVKQLLKQLSPETEMKVI
jgi:adenine-specific DNA-methyltransferase